MLKCLTIAHKGVTPRLRQLYLYPTNYTFKIVSTSTSFHSTIGILCSPRPPPHSIPPMVNPPNSSLSYVQFSKNWIICWNSIKPHMTLLLDANIKIDWKQCVLRGKKSFLCVLNPTVVWLCLHWCFQYTL